jgi:hypothetical protein
MLARREQALEGTKGFATHHTVERNAQVRCLEAVSGCQLSNSSPPPFGGFRPKLAIIFL